MVDEPHGKNEKANRDQNSIRMRVEGDLTLVQQQERTKDANKSSEPQTQAAKISRWRSAPRWIRGILASSNFWTALATVVIAGFTVALYCVSTRQWQTMEKQLELSERPWLSAEIKILGPLTFDPDGTGHMLIAQKITNSGNSPADYAFDEVRFIPMGVKRDRINGGKSFSAPMEADRICKDLQRRAENPTNKANGVGYTLFPNKSAVRIQPLQLHADDIKEAIDYSRPFNGPDYDGVMPIIIGCIDYGFVFEKGRHQTQFTWMISDAQGRSIQPKGMLQLENLRLTWSPPNVAN